jgi:cytochrome d ubiquinol oxidase subunit I
MFLLGTYFIGLTSLGVILLWRRRLFQARWYLRLALWSLPLPFVASEVGWIAAEMGRQPWIVTGMLLTKDAVSATVPPAQVLTSIIIFGAVYSLLFYLWLFLLRKKLAAGPAEVVVGANQRTAAPAATGEAAC